MLLLGWDPMLDSVRDSEDTVCAQVGFLFFIPLIGLVDMQWPIWSVCRSHRTLYTKSKQMKTSIDEHAIAFLQSCHMFHRLRHLNEAYHQGVLLDPDTEVIPIVPS